jgi:hypothetical protein
MAICCCRGRLFVTLDGFAWEDCSLDDLETAIEAAYEYREAYRYLARPRAVSQSLAFQRA